MKFATVPKFKLFRELNTTLNGWRLIIVFCKWIGHLLTHFVCLFTIVACNLLLHFIGGSINSLVWYRLSVKSTSWKFDITILVTLHEPINELFSFHMIQKNSFCILWSTKSFLHHNYKDQLEWNTRAGVHLLPSMLSTIPGCTAAFLLRCKFR